MKEILDKNLSTIGCSAEGIEVEVYNIEKNFKKKVFNIKDFSEKN